jgi:hypothetical protein
VFVLVFLEACMLFRLSVLSRVSGAELIPGASLSRVRLFGYLRLVLMFLAFYRALVVWRVLEQ